MTMDSPAPLPAGADGLYPAPQPDILKNREYQKRSTGVAADKWRIPFVVTP